ncbi:MAG TPA: ABC transporter ATP-binding protein [Halanaerobiales bacterium]|nr:ABC transporter ATP-binding protein [Halanaerobiales bacterium]
MIQSRSGYKYLQLEDIVYSYPQTGFQLKGINLGFKRGEFTAISGPNGSGKTTLGKIMAGIIKADSGQVMIDGLDTREVSLGRIGKRVGYLFQEPGRQLFTGSVKEELAFTLSFREEEKEEIERLSKKALEDFSLSGLEEEAPFRLSAGEKQRLALAALIINQPDFLILDEPTKGLDPLRKEELTVILKNLQDSGVGMAVISHDNSFIEENADRIILLSRGELIETRSTH